MDDLLKRQNVAGQGGFDPNSADGGDLNGGDGLHRKPGESDVGSGLELDRSLQRVAAQEAWLNEQSRMPVESWLQTHSAQEISIDGIASSKNSISDDIGSNKSLIVIDSRSNKCEELCENLPDNTDFLIIDSDQGGIDQFTTFLSESSNDVQYSDVSIIGSAKNDFIFFGSEILSSNQLAQQIGEFIGSSGLKYNNFKLYTSDLADSSIGVVNVGLIGSANNLLLNAKEVLSNYDTTSQISNLSLGAFSGSKKVAISNNIDKFINGTIEPSVEWADFGDSSIKGAYISEQSKILINSDLYGNKSVVDRVLIEEIGHWLDDISGIGDSEGDEGEQFANLIFGQDGNLNSGRDNAILFVNGSYFVAELAAATASAATTVTANNGGSGFKLTFSDSVQSNSVLLNSLSGADLTNLASTFHIQINSSTSNSRILSAGTGAGTFSLEADSSDSTNTKIDFVINSVSDYVVSGDTIEIFYNAPGTAVDILESTSQTDLTADFSVSVTNNSSFTQTLAQVSTAATAAADSGGSTIDLKFTEALTSNGTLVSAIGDYTDLASAFQIDIDGRILDSSKFTLSSDNDANAPADDNKFITLTITNVADYIQNGEDIRVFYNAPVSDHKLVDSDGNVTLDFTETVDITATTFFRNEAPVQFKTDPVIGFIKEDENFTITALDLLSSFSDA